MTERRKLTADEVHLAAVLRAAWERKKSSDKVTQHDAGEALGFSASAFGQYINGKLPIGLGALLKMCKYLAVDPEEPPIPELVRELENWTPVHGVSESDVQEGLYGDVVSVQAMDIRVIAGNGDGMEVQTTLSETESPVFYQKSWLKKRRFRAEDLLSFTVSGSSMEPALFDGDKVTVNTASREPKHGVAFVVAVEHTACIKRLKKKSGVWWITSDNPAYSRFDVELENTNQIIGEAVDKSSTHI
jgi:phage repressor protein C with HTH and peptisase S24 domain